MGVQGCESSSSMQPAMLVQGIGYSCYFRTTHACSRGRSMGPSHRDIGYGPMHARRLRTKARTDEASTDRGPDAVSVWPSKSSPVSSMPRARGVRSGAALEEAAAGFSKPLKARCTWTARSRAVGSEELSCIKRSNVAGPEVGIGTDICTLSIAHSCQGARCRAQHEGQVRVCFGCP